LSKNFWVTPCWFLQCAFASRTPNPLLRRAGVSFLVWVITCDLSGKGDPTSSYTTASITLRIIWPLKPSPYFKVETHLGGWILRSSTTKTSCSKIHSLWLIPLHYSSDQKNFPSIVSQGDFINYYQLQQYTNFRLQIKCQHSEIHLKASTLTL
jgi:hypothetical protein